MNERDPWYPLRALIRAPEPEGMRTALTALENSWAATIARASELPEAKLHQSVNGEWSFVETLRHLVFAIDKWFTVPLVGGNFHLMGLPNRGSTDFPWPGLDRNASPTFGEAVEARAERLKRLSAYLETLAPADLTTTVEILENRTNPVRECLFTVFDEEFAHNRYASRDLAARVAAFCRRARLSHNHTRLRNTRATRRSAVEAVVLAVGKLARCHGHAVCEVVHRRYLGDVPGLFQREAEREQMSNVFP